MTVKQCDSWMLMTEIRMSEHFSSCLQNQQVFHRTNSITLCYNSLVCLNEGLFGGTPRFKGSFNRVLEGSESCTPGSPVARRTKQEIKSAKRNARKYSEQPVQWTRYLLSICHR